ncbi:MAG TPA: molybdopterin-dependent oxidoreductase [Duganella sp.]|uniref:molybdopterin-containing oxidoreductase family protein n=1 Tax=Duganella sp. TaxID=1904440 RepID=UPI002ED000A5
MDRRGFIKSGIGSMATLGLGETILLTPNAAGAMNYRPLADGRQRKVKNDYRRAKRIASVCLNCSTVCGIEAFVQDDKVIKIRGNPLDPNMGGYMTCAKGQSGPTINDYPERLLYPLKRVGARGEGKWQRISWEQAYTEVAERIKASIASGHPERVALHQGRSRIDAEINRFLSAIGTPVQLNHRALCSSNKRAANYVSLGETDWESIDAERCKYFLNFGANFYEAHQGGLHLVSRVVKARFDHGAKLVTFDVRLSNTAGRSDEWHQPFPGTEGAVALAMAHVIIRENEIDHDFVAKFVQPGLETMRAWLATCTPEWAAGLSGIAARDIERLALEFARLRPAVAAFTNRGTGAHYNGFNAERAVVMLNALVGSIAKPGGYCYGLEEKLSAARYPQPQPVPPAPKLRTDLEDPPEWPLANRWQKMKVGQIVYDYLRQGRAKLDVYLSYTIGSPMTWPEGRSTTVEVLLDEKLIPFHACSDVVYSEMAHYADLILPDATYLERWGMDIRNNLELTHYVALRQPLVPPPGEARSYADVLFEIGRRLAPEQAKYFQFGGHEDFVRVQCSKLPTTGPDGRQFKDGFDYMKHYGVYVDLSQPKPYQVYQKPLGDKQLDGSRVDAGTGVIYRPNDKGKEAAVGLLVDGKAVRGFSTPSRKFEVHAPEVTQVAKTLGIVDDGLPTFAQIPSHHKLPADRFILTTFKWNVHTQARTASQKYLVEIVHDNPMWINAGVAKKLGLKSGDMVELTTYRPRSGPADQAGQQAYRGTGEKIGSARMRVFVTRGIHPRVVAVSNSVGWISGGRASEGRNGRRVEVAARGIAPDAAKGFGPAPALDDLNAGVWWDERNGGKGNGVNINALLPINPQPLVGMQAWFDTVCSLRKVT